jgi:uncharacterized membrane protein YphA (DoxX/SURF4 family)
MHPTFRRIDRRIEACLYRLGHTTHGATLGIVFIWFGLLKVFEIKTATSILAQTIYFGDPDLMVRILGGWEIAIGICLIFHKLLRLALLLLAIRLPGTVLALVFKSDVCFEVAPWIPSIQGQYIIKDFMLFSAAAVMGGYVGRHPSRLRALQRAERIRKIQQQQPAADTEK